MFKNYLDSPSSIEIVSERHLIPSDASGSTRDDVPWERPLILITNGESYTPQLTPVRGVFYIAKYTAVDTVTKCQTPGIRAVGHSLLESNPVFHHSLTLLGYNRDISKQFA